MKKWGITASIITTLKRAKKNNEYNATQNKQNYFNMNSAKKHAQNLTEVSSETISVDATQIEGTPFNKIVKDGKKFIVLGDYRLTEDLTDEDIDDWVKDINWNKITQVIMCLIHKNNINSFNDLIPE